MGLDRLPELPAAILIDHQFAFVTDRQHPHLAACFRGKPAVETTFPPVIIGDALGLSGIRVE